MNGTFYVVPTPIGNLEDITLRAIRILKQVDIVLAEDTRTSSKLLKHYEIETPVHAFHQHNEHHKLAFYIQQLEQGKNIAQISDAGTPGISDPGFLMIRACLQHEIPFEVLPGATAFVPALLLSGFPNHEFVFMGFLPAKKGRQTMLQNIQNEKRTIILYESPHKINTLLLQLKEYVGENHHISISRELTKMFEETIRGTVAEVIEKTKEKNWKGELVIVIHEK